MSSRARWVGRDGENVLYEGMEIIYCSEFGVECGMLCGRDGENCFIKYDWNTIHCEIRTPWLISNNPPLFEETF